MDNHGGDNCRRIHRTRQVWHDRRLNRRARLLQDTRPLAHELPDLAITESSAVTTSESGPPRRPKPPCPRCGGDRQVRRIGDYLRHTCITCGHGEEEYQPRGLAYETTTPPKTVEPLRSNNMPETDSNDEQSTVENLIAKFDAGLEISEPVSIRRLLHAELDAASGRYPRSPIVHYSDGTPARVSWLDQHGILRHRPFDGPFPPGYPQRLAVHQCQQVLFRLLGMEKHRCKNG